MNKYFFALLIAAAVTFYAAAQEQDAVKAIADTSSQADRLFTFEELFDFRFTQTHNLSKNVVKNHRRNLTLAPGAFSASMVLVGYEQQLEQNWSLKLMAGFAISEKNRFYGADLIGYHLEVQPRYYFGRQGADRSAAYFAPFFSHRSLSYNTDNERIALSKATTGVLMGFRGYTRNSFCIDLFAGPAMIMPLNGQTSAHLLDFYYRQLGLNAGIHLGFGF